jgi:signal transduction histidine kinase
MLYRVKRDDGLSGSQWGVLAGAFLSILFIFQVTAQQIDGDRRRAIESEIHQNQARTQIFQQYVLRTLEMAKVATDQLATRLEAGDISTADGARGIVDTSFLPKMNYVEGVAVSFGDRDHLLTGPRSLSLSNWRALRKFALAQPTDAAITPPFTAPGGTQIVALTRRLRSDRRSGFIGILFQPHHMLDFSREVQFDQNDLVSLIGLDGITRARREGAQFSTGEDLRGRLVMQRQAISPNGSYYGPSSLDGRWRIFSHRRIPEYGVFATSGVSMDQLIATLEARRNFQLAMLAAAVAAIVAATGVLVSGIGQRRRQFAILSAANAKLNEAQRIGGMGDWDYWPTTDELVWSNNLCALYGRDRNHRITPLASLGDLIDVKGRRAVQAGLKAIARSGKAASWDIVATLADGQRSHRRIIAEPVIDKNGKVLRIHGVDQSTDQERHMAQLQERLAGHARLDAMNALAATLAHELNQPLGVAANFVAAARRRLRAAPTDSDGFDYLDQAEEQIVAVAEIIGAARQSLSGSSADRHIFSIAEAVDKARLLLRGHPGESRARIDVRIDPAAADAVGNMALVKQVIHNLVKNAIEAIPEGRRGEVLISTAPDIGGAILFVSVRDNGVGIANGIDPFTALGTHKDGGLGLGLALSRTIVESLGGKIWVEQTGAGGTEISFSLPTPPPDGASLVH